MGTKDNDWFGSAFFNKLIILTYVKFLRPYLPLVHMVRRDWPQRQECLTNEIIEINLFFIDLDEEN